MSAQHSSFHLHDFNFISEVTLIVITIIIENMGFFLLHRAIPSLIDSVVCPFWEFVAPQVCTTYVLPDDIFFLHGPFFKSLLNLSQCCFCFMFWFFGHQAFGILTPWPGIKPTPSALEGRVLTGGLPGKSLMICLDMYNSLHLKHGCPISILLLTECKTSVIWLLWDIKLWTAFRDETVTF